MRKKNQKPKPYPKGLANQLLYLLERAPRMTAKKMAKKLGPDSPPPTRQEYPNRGRVKYHDR